MRRAAKIDRNQPEIVAAFRGQGFSVLMLHSVGHGCPDILIGKRGSNHLIEIKDGKKPPSARKLTPDEQKFHDEWRGSVFVVDSIEAALQLGIQLDNN